MTTRIDESTQAESLFFYSPDSLIWRINREQVLLLGGARALLMQIAHPLVAESVYQHSYVFEKPLLRLHRTLDLTLSLVFGTRTEVQASIDEINRVHRPATGRLENEVGDYSAGTPYNPRNPRLAMWVYATLVEGALYGYEAFIGKLSDTQKQIYYEDSQKSVELLGVKPSRLPSTYQGLLDYMNEAIESGEVTVGETARQIAPFILLQSSPLTLPFSYPISRMTTAMLPHKIRQQYDFPLHPLEQKGVARLCQMTRSMHPLLPPILRYVSAYRRALGILRQSEA